MKPISLVVCAVAHGITLVQVSTAQPVWQTFHPLPGTGTDVNTQNVLSGFSADGTVAVGYVWNGGFQQGVVWVNGEMRLLPSTAERSIPSDVSGDGRFIVGTTIIGSLFQASVWERVDGEYVQYDMPDLPGGGIFSKIYAVSRDGRRAVGIGRSQSSGVEATVWRLDEGPGVPPTGLGFLPPWNIGWSEAYAVSPDGSIVAGTGRNDAGELAFTNRLGEVAPEPGIHGIVGASRIIGMTPDAGVMVGGSRIPVYNSPWEPTIWIDGVASLLPAAPGMDFSNGAFAGSITDDGSIISGTVFTSPGGYRIMWVNGEPMYQSDWIESLNLPSDGWTNLRGTITPDGRYFVGNGINPEGLSQGFVAIVPAPGALSMLVLSGLVMAGSRRRWVHAE